MCAMWRPFLGRDLDSNDGTQKAKMVPTLSGSLRPESYVATLHSK